MANYVYCWHETNYHAIKVGMTTVDPRARMDDYAKTYGLRTATLRTITLPPGLDASHFEDVCHTHLRKLGMKPVRHLAPASGDSTQELFELGGRSYDDAVQIVADLVTVTQRAVAKAVLAAPEDPAAQVRLQNQQARARAEQAERDRKAREQAERERNERARATAETERLAKQKLEQRPAVTNEWIKWNRFFAIHRPHVRPSDGVVYEVAQFAILSVISFGIMPVAMAIHGLRGGDKGDAKRDLAKAGTSYRAMLARYNSLDAPTRTRLDSAPSWEGNEDLYLKLAGVVVNALKPAEVSAPRHAPAPVSAPLALRPAPVDAEDNWHAALSPPAPVSAPSNYSAQHKEWNDRSGLLDFGAQQDKLLNAPPALRPAPVDAEDNWHAALSPPFKPAPSFEEQQEKLLR
jgi:hypothetical protein